MSSHNVPLIMKCRHLQTWFESYLCLKAASQLHVRSVLNYVNWIFSVTALVLIICQRHWLRHNSLPSSIRLRHQWNQMLSLVDPIIAKLQNFRLIGLKLVQLKWRCYFESDLIRIISCHCDFIIGWKHTLGRKLTEIRNSRVEWNIITESVSWTLSIAKHDQQA